VIHWGDCVCISGTVRFWINLNMLASKTSVTWSPARFSGSRQVPNRLTLLTPTSDLLNVASTVQYVRRVHFNNIISAPEILEVWRDWLMKTRWEPVQYKSEMGACKTHASKGFNCHVWKRQLSKNVCITETVQLWFMPVLFVVSFSLLNFSRVPC